MAFLASQASVLHVVGLDGIRTALEEFAKEQPDLEIQANNPSADHKYERWSGKKITLLKGDYFHFDETASDGRFGAIFDRASLVAIDPKLRRDYVDVIGKVIAPGGKILLVTLERRGSDQAAVQSGPPFSVTESQVRELYEGLEWVESVSVLEMQDTFVTDPSQKARYEGLDSMMECVFLIQAK